MKLQQIKLKNFRQFYGEQEIKFSTTNKNVTIIFGENGRGKTGLFRALMFGLYGARYLPQDNKKEKIHLVNLNKLNENLNQPVEAKVVVKFEDKNKEYIIQRSIKGYNSGAKIKESDNNEAQLSIIDETGNFSPNPITDQEEIENIIDGILDRKIKDFFLFDGEKIETLSKTDKQVRKEIRQGIIKLLHIDKLDRAINILNDLQNKERKRIEKKTSNINIKEAENKIQACQQELENLNEKLNIKQENRALCEEEITELEQKLSENEEIKELQDQLEQLEKEIQEKKNTRAVLKKTMVDNYFNQGHYFFMKDIYGQTLDYLEQIYTEQDDIVPIELLEKILTEEECICGTDLSQSDWAREKIKKLKNDFSRGELTPMITMINGAVHDFKNSKEQTLENIKSLLDQYRNKKESLEELNREREQLRSEIKEFSQQEENLNQLEENLEEKEADLADLKEEINGLEKDIKLQEKELKEAEKKYKDLLQKDKNLSYEYKKLDYVERLNDQFEETFTKYSHGMREKLMEEMTNIFKTLIDAPNKDLLKRVEINEKYEIELINWSENTITQDISQGQRQILSLSFITALAKVASGGEDTINFPLFMDTPFGRLSGKNRDNLIENIPDLTSQWVLLLTDTEFSKSEEEKIKETDRLGRWYVLEQVNKGHTNIVEKDLNTSIANRR